jgi:hypothetical protein
MNHPNFRMVFLCSNITNQQSEKDVIHSKILHPEELNRHFYPPFLINLPSYIKSNIKLKK